LRPAHSIWRFRNRWKPWLRRSHPSHQSPPARNGHRTTGGALESGGAALCSPIHLERSAVEIARRNRARMVSSAQSTLGLIRGKWKITILVTMLDGPVRLGELRRLLPRASKKVLVQQLRLLEKDGIIVRTDLSGRVKRVEYTISAPLGTAVMNLLGFLSDWGIRHLPLAPLNGPTLFRAKSGLNIAARKKTAVRMENQPCTDSCPPVSVLHRQPAPIIPGKAHLPKEQRLSRTRQSKSKGEIDELPMICSSTARWNRL